MVSCADAQGAARTVAGLLIDGLRESPTRLSHRDHAIQLMDGRGRHPPWHDHRRATRFRRCQRSGHIAARDVHDAADFRDHSSHFHILGGAFRRRHHLNTFQHPRRAVVGRHDFRRLPDGAAGTRRSGADRRVYFLLRGRAFLDPVDYVLRSSLGGDRSQIRPAGNLCHSISHVLQFRGAGRRQPTQVAGLHSNRVYPRDRRPRHRHRPAAPDLRHYRVDERL